MKTVRAVLVFADGRVHLEDVAPAETLVLETDRASSRTRRKFRMLGAARASHADEAKVTILYAEVPVK